MTAVTTTRTASAVMTATTPAPPRITSNLAIWINDVGQNQPLRPLPAVVRAEAQNALTALDGVCRPAGDTPGKVRTWLLSLNAGSTIPLTANDFAIRSGAMLPQLEALPTALFGPQVLKQAMLTFPYFPGLADLNAWLLNETPPACTARSDCKREARCTNSCRAGFHYDGSGRPDVRTWQRDRAALCKVVALPEPEPPKVPTQEERDAILADFRKKMAQVHAERIDREAAKRLVLPVGAPLPDVSIKGETLTIARSSNRLVQAALIEQRMARTRAEEAAKPRRREVRLPWNEDAA
jgi:hypothetical protein